MLRMSRSTTSLSVGPTLSSRAGGPCVTMVAVVVAVVVSTIAVVVVAVVVTAVGVL